MVPHPGLLHKVGIAAAEDGRDNGGTSFVELDELPTWFSDIPNKSHNTNLFYLFQPQDSTKSLFNIFTSGLGSNSPKLRMLMASLKEYFILTLLGLVLGLIPLALALVSYPTWGIFALLLIPTMALVLVAIIILIGRKLIYTISNSIPENSYGLCNGMTTNNPYNAKALTDWMAELFDRLAGIVSEDGPLTYGHLYGYNKDDDIDKKVKKINLLTMTTCLTHSRPYTMPFNEDFFYFQPEEMRVFFPEYVVDWMVKKSPDYKPNKNLEYYKKEILKLPSGYDLPVIFGARLSLSFPILLSAVPLYYIDGSKENTNHSNAEKLWFSDGGICSNFPIHFFDKAIPNRPTFGINLVDVKDDQIKEEECDNSKMPDTYLDPRSPFWDRFHENGGLFSFVWSIINSMMSWRDNTQMNTLGYWDRVVHIDISETEGGLQLNMEDDVITALGDRGHCAGKKIVDTYTRDTDYKKDEVNWDSHRWVRFRSSISLAVESLITIYESYTQLERNPNGLDKPYSKLVKNPPSKKYDWDDNLKDKDFVLNMIKMLKNIETSWKNQKHDHGRKQLKIGAPKPEPEVRIMPKI